MVYPLTCCILATRVIYFVIIYHRLFSSTSLHLYCYLSQLSILFLLCLSHSREEIRMFPAQNSLQIPFNARLKKTKHYHFGIQKQLLKQFKPTGKLNEVEEFESYCQLNLKEDIHFNSGTV